MSIKFRSYTNQLGYTEDFEAVSAFLARINQKQIVNPNYLWARWRWQFGPYMNEENISSIGIAIDNGIIVGLVTYESNIGEAFLCLDVEYNFLREEMINYAIKHLSIDGKLKITLPDGDLDYQKLALQKGFRATEKKTSVAVIDIDNLNYTLPEGYSIISFADSEFDVDRYYNAIWRGFNNQRQKNERELKSDREREGFNDPLFHSDIRIVVVSPTGDYAAHCGMWHLSGTDYAYAEPVFTLPEYRKIGLGKAAVLEGLKRCEKRGATKAYVVSGQQFYYSIGFYPVYNETWWSN